MQICSRLTFLFGFLLMTLQPTRADTLAVGQQLPDAQLLQVLDGQEERLTTFADVISDKTIVFVFASW